jgi:hypothetical protein
MLVAIGLIGVLMSMGVAGYLALNRGYDLSAIEGSLEAVVRQARNTTLHENAPAGAFLIETFRLELAEPTEFMEGEILGGADGILTFAPKGRLKLQKIPQSRVLRRETVRAMRAIGFRTIALWHLEMSNAEAGFLGRECRPENCEAVLGKIGGAVYLNPTLRSRSKIVALPAPDDDPKNDPYRMPSGGRIAMWLYADRATSGYVFRREKDYELKVSAEGVLEGGPPGTTLTAEGYTLPLGRWVYLVMQFSTTYVEIIADGVSRGVCECDGFESPDKGKLYFGENFIGLMDEIRVQRRVVGEAVEIPSDFDFSGPTEIFFDHRGRLDAKRHAGPVELKLARDGKEVGISISRSGLIE